ALAGENGQLACARIEAGSLCRRQCQGGKAGSGRGQPGTGGEVVGRGDGGRRCDACAGANQIQEPGQSCGFRGTAVQCDLIRWQSRIEGNGCLGKQVVQSHRDGADGG